jgi:predicted XRE-type DNA-binding protein
MSSTYNKCCIIVMWAAFRMYRRRKQVKSENKPSHITRGDVFDDLGLSHSEASALKIKATLLDAILREIEKRGYTQSQLVEILDEYQPSVSNLTRGRISKVSLEKLLAYSDRLKMNTTLSVRASSAAPRNNNARRHSRLSASSTTRDPSRSRVRRQAAASGS